MRITINKKLVGLFSIFVFIFTVFIVTSLIVIKDLNNTLKESNFISRKVNLTGDLQFEINRLLNPVNNYLITGDIKERDVLDNIQNEMARLFAEIKPLRGEERWTSASEKVEKDSIDLGKRAIEIIYMENPVGNKGAHELASQLRLLSDILIKEVEEFHRISEEEVIRMEVEVERKAKKTAAYTIVLVAAAFLSIPLLYYYIKRAVISPIKKLHDGAGIIAKGDFKERININTGDEIEDLAKEFNVMAASLEEAKIELDRRIFELYTLYNISKVLSTSFEVEELLSKVVDNVTKGLKIDGVVIMLIDDKTNELYVASYTNFRGKGLEKTKFKIGEGFYGWIAVTGEPCMAEVEKVGDITPDERIDDDVNSIIVMPLGVRGRILGLLNVYKNKPLLFDGKDFELLKAVAEHVALALENAKLYKETKLMAITDGITGLYNHRFFMEKLSEEMERAIRYRHPLSLIMIDIDYFKHYNDAHGHQFGDNVLKLMAEIFKKTIRSADFAARYGGEEFSIILPETDMEHALPIAERIRKTVEDYSFPREETQPDGNMTISIGVASAAVITENDIEGLIKKADDAMYEAKETGRNRVVVWR